MLAQGILFGLASMLIYNPVVSVPSQWFYHRRALATAIATSASGLGGTLWPIILQNLISSVGESWYPLCVMFQCPIPDPYVGRSCGHAVTHDHTIGRP